MRPVAPGPAGATRTPGPPCVAPGPAGATRTPGPALVAAALVPLAVLVVDPAGWFPFGPVKWLVVSVLVPLGAALLWRDRPVRVQRAATVASLALVAWLAVAAAAG